MRVGLREFIVVWRGSFRLPAGGLDVCVGAWSFVFIEGSFRIFKLDNAETVFIEVPGLLERRELRYFVGSLPKSSNVVLEISLLFLLSLISGFVLKVIFWIIGCVDIIFPTF